MFNHIGAPSSCKMVLSPRARSWTEVKTAALEMARLNDDQSSDLHAQVHQVHTTVLGNTAWRDKSISWTDLDIACKSLMVEQVKERFTFSNTVRDEDEEETEGGNEDVNTASHQHQGNSELNVGNHSRCYDIHQQRTGSISGWEHVDDSNEPNNYFDDLDDTRYRRTTVLRQRTGLTCSKNVRVSLNISSSDVKTAKLWNN